MISFKNNNSSIKTDFKSANRMQSIRGKILIAGAENSLARFLANGLLDAGAKVSVQAVNTETVLSAKRNFQVIPHAIADTRFGEALSTLAPDTIIHAISESSHQSSSQWPSANFNRIIDKTAVLCEAVRRYAPNSHLIMLSTIDVYGECAIQMKEEMEPFPSSMKGRYTRIAEQILNDFSDAHNLKSTILRIASAYGPNVRNNPVHDLLLNLLGSQGTNSKVPINQNATRDLIHAADVLQAVNIILQQTPGGIYNIASGTCLSNSELNTHLCSILDLPQSILSMNSTANEITTQRVDIEKLKSLGFKPQVPLIEGLRGYSAWWSGTKAA